MVLVISQRQYFLQIARSGELMKTQLYIVHCILLGLISLRRELIKSDKIVQSKITFS